MMRMRRYGLMTEFFLFTCDVRNVFAQEDDADIGQVRQSTGVYPMTPEHTRSVVRSILRGVETSKTMKTTLVDSVGRVKVGDEPYFTREDISMDCDESESTPSMGPSGSVKLTKYSTLAMETSGSDNAKFAAQTIHRQYNEQHNRHGDTRVAYMSCGEYKLDVEFLNKVYGNIDISRLCERSPDGEPLLFRRESRYADHMEKVLCVLYACY